jgi:hypothetical protein
MGLREFWKKLTGGDNPDEVPHKPEDYEGMKDDQRIAERYPGTERLSDDHL